MRVVITVVMVMLRDFGSYGIIFINVYVVITVVMVMVVRGFGPCGI
jgi:hypothetical protein